MCLYIQMPFDFQVITVLVVINVACPVFHSFTCIAYIWGQCFKLIILTEKKMKSSEERVFVAWCCLKNFCLAVVTDLTFFLVAKSEL